MNELSQLGDRVGEIQKNVLVPAARRFGFELPANHLQPNRLPTVLFLGNHSSGKSSFINHLVEKDVQKTGLAPTDDGFTVLMHGEVEDEADGSTTATHPQLNCQPLAELGDSFLSKLRLKTLPHPVLESLVLIDSPGMIDAATAENDRGYDFAYAVETFAERADLILFFFDPDKPGTTGETLRIFTEILSGMSHKLLILMHKVDQFQNIRDFARTYGTLCWNLAKIIKSKDIPHIFNTYLPTEQIAEEKDLPLHDFGVSREEVIDQIRRAPLRRMDNLVSDLYRDTSQILVHTRVLGNIGRRTRRISLAAAGVALLGLIGGGLTAWLSWKNGDTGGAALAATAGIVLAVLVMLGSRFAIRLLGRRYRNPAELEKIFQDEFREELSIRSRGDLFDSWAGAQSETARWFQQNDLRPGLSKGVRPTARKLRKLLDEDLPNLRRRLTGE